MRPLGATGIAVSEIGFGTWAIGGNAPGALGYGAADDDQSLAALSEARRLGCTFFDTSNLYGLGRAETLLGTAFAGCRDSVVLATKAGYVTADGEQDFSADGVRRSLDASLARLRTSYVDLLQLHNPAPDVLARGDELMAALDALRRGGAIRAFGLSARTPDEALLFATRYAPPALQVNFNIADLRARRNGLLDLCQARGIGLIVRTPLAAGFLTGGIPLDRVFSADDHRRRYDAAARRRWADAVQRVRPVFGDVPAATPAQNALRFCLSFPAVSTVIPGMTQPAEVRDNLAAAALPALDARQLAVIDTVYDQVFG